MSESELGRRVSTATTVRPPVLQLFQHDLGSGEQIDLEPGLRVLYNVARNEAIFDTGARTLTAEDGHLVRIELAADPDPSADLAQTLDIGFGPDCIVRCDRVDLPASGVAEWHTHQGPGIRCLVEGGFRVSTDTGMRRIPLFGSWFEAGPEPVRAQAWESGPSAFVRVMILPRHLLGKSSIRYVEDGIGGPRPQRYTVFLDEPVDLRTVLDR